MGTTLSATLLFLLNKKLIDGRAKLAQPAAIHDPVGGPLWKQQDGHFWLLPPKVII